MFRGRWVVYSQFESSPALGEPLDRKVGMPGTGPPGRWWCCGGVVTSVVTSATPLADVDIPGSGLEPGTAPGDRRFRPDVQGLRAVAVLVVVFFHAHLPGFGGGYVGVDVFFVISGFVITGVLLREDTATNSVSILGFYARRARRIIPAATLVIIVAVIAAYVVLGPLSGNATADDARWASIFLINVHFASSGTNYLASLSPPRCSRTTGRWPWRSSSTWCTRPSSCWWSNSRRAGPGGDGWEWSWPSPWWRH